MANKISNSSKRLQELMDILHIKQSDVVARTGINKSALSNYLHGTREPRQDQISKIADPYGINPAWLMGYDVPMYLSQNFSSMELNINEQDMIRVFRELDEESQRQAVLMLAFLKDQNDKN